MAKKPIFTVTHPRACSTAFERVFMTCRDTLACAHEPFGDAFYYGPERLSERFENNEKARVASGFQDSTYRTILDRLDEDGAEGKRLFIKDIAYYLFPCNEKPAVTAPSLERIERGVGTNGSLTNGSVANGNGSNGHTVNGSNGHAVNGSNGHAANGSNGHTVNGFMNGKTATNGAIHETNGHEAKIGNGDTMEKIENPTVIPESILKEFHFTFLIRHPRNSIPSYYRCTIPPLDDMTGFYNFMPAEAGYSELRRLFDYLRASGQVGPNIAGQEEGKGEVSNGHDGGKVDICVLDADDLLDNPSSIIQKYCRSVDLEYTSDMLVWDTEEDNKQAHDAFEKWRGFHEDVMDSTYLKPRDHARIIKNPEEEDKEWAKKYGQDAAKVIRETVDANVADYEYLKQFALRP